MSTRTTSTRRTGRGAATTGSLRLAGIAVAALWVLAIIVTDAMQDGTTRNIITDPASAQQVILDHQLVIAVEAVTSLYLAALLVAFAAALRHTLAGIVPATAAFGGAVLAAVAIILGAAVSFAELAAAHHDNATALTTLGYLVAYSWAWEGATWGFFLLATGWAILRTGAGPRWFAVTTIVLGVPVALGPGAILFWALAPVWFVLAGYLVKPRDDAGSGRPADELASLPVTGR